MTTSFEQNQTHGPSTASTIERDPAHSTEDLLDVVFALMSDDPAMFAEDQATRPWILCIDDDYDFSRVLARRLGKFDVGVINAYDGTDGVRTAFTQPASAIILDFNMPNGDGSHVLRQLRQNPSTCTIPVIVLTGNKSPEVRHTMTNLGASAFMYKPPQMDLLIAELRRHIPLGASS